MKKVRVRDRVEALDMAGEIVVTGRAQEVTPLEVIIQSDDGGIVSCDVGTVRRQDHEQLLAARRAVHHLPTGEPRRVAAQRAVRQSRISRRSNSSWAIRALNSAQTRAAREPDPARALAALSCGIETAKQWLYGTHPLAH